MFGYVTAAAAAFVFQPWALIPIFIVGCLELFKHFIDEAAAMPQSYHNECARIDNELREKGM